jgi:Leucine-rich repeat (LRR) protein
MSSNFVILVVFCAVSLINSPAEGVTCTYEIDTRDNSYGCRLIDQVVRNENDLAEISGRHLDGYSEEQVTTLFGGNSTIEIFPTAIIDKFVNMKRVWLAMNKMKSLPRPITNCAYLTSINLNFNEIKTLPAGIFEKCGELTELMLMGNGMTTIYNDALKGLVKLGSLELQSNNITTLDPNMFTPIFALKTLNLESNQISSFPLDIFTRLTQLNELNLRSNKFSSWSINRETLTHQLNVLYLAGNEIKTVEPTAFASFPALKTLSIGSLIETVPAFTNVQSLEQLYLDGNKIKTVSIESFRNVNALRQLHISNNLVESVNFTKLATNTLAQLQVLFLDGNKIDSLAENSFTALSLTHLNLRGNQLKKLEALDVKLNVRLSVLDVTNNKIENIEREIFQNVTNPVQFRAKGNVCVNDDYIIDRNWTTRVAPSLEKCFNFGVMTHANVFVLTAATLLSVVVKML